MKVIVVGSGPAGVSVAQGLLERGCEVTLVDVGNVLEPEKQTLLSEFQNNPSINMSALRHHANGKKNLKLPYGSNFIYEGVKDFFSWKTEDCYFQPSFAQGGLSNVWGGVVEQYSPKELSAWPQACRDLSPYYSKITSWLGKHYGNDASLSQQALYIKNVWLKHQLELLKNGFSFRDTTLAMDSNRCRLCGSCQYGCPYGLIYHASIHLDLLRQNPHFNYVNGVVESFSENNQQAELLVRDKQSKEYQRLFCDRLFIACGAGLSSLLYLRSLNQPGKKLFLKDSQHFVLPCLLDKAPKDVMKESLHTLCQLNASIVDKTVSDHPVYLQFYTYMDFYLQEIKNKLKMMYPVVKPLITSWIERLVVIQGYLDSKESNHMSIQYQASGEFIIKKDSSISTQATINKVICFMKQHRQALLLKPLRFLLSSSLTGQSNHVTGSLPMSENPQDNEVDVWGRPSHCHRIHFVDGSILPAIPAGPTTLTIMANAYRIGKEVPL